MNIRAVNLKKYMKLQNRIHFQKAIKTTWSKGTKSSCSRELQPGFARRQMNLEASSWWLFSNLQNKQLLRKIWYWEQTRTETLTTVNCNLIWRPHRSRIKCFYSFSVMKIDPRVLHMVGKYSITELLPDQVLYFQCSLCFWLYHRDILIKVQ